MANGTSALASQRRERAATDPSWPGVTVSAATVTRTHVFGGKSGSATPPWTDLQARVVGGGFKRGFDVTAALTAIILLLPMLCLIALAIKLWDRGPVFYRHRRIGLGGSGFDCLKFRSMVVNGDEVLSRHLTANSTAAREWEATRKLRDDPRITPLGASMRKTSIDELPQLVNILKGEMSFVGPRPIVTAEVPKYGDAIGHYLCARPGLTGPWQISGRNDVDYSTRVALDRGYVEEWSFWRDVSIIAKTARVVVTARGCY
ncbi:MAG TPA: sugar transferase [Stellaceae bacterium]|jgi:exopolysaccharide production protein ExoY